MRFYVCHSQGCVNNSTAYSLLRFPDKNDITYTEHIRGWTEPVSLDLIIYPVLYWVSVDNYYL